jgi:cell wall-associated NlpC family hydrolase
LLITEIARSLMKRGIRYEFFEERCNPPELMNCYLFVWWVFEQCAGIYMPKDIIGQLYRGEHVDTIKDIQDAGLIFTTGRWGAYYDDDRAQEGVGHTGIITVQGSVIHACAGNNGVAEVPLWQFLEGRELRGMFHIA